MRDRDSRMANLAAAIRSCVFALGLVLLTPPFAMIALLIWPLPPLTRYRIVSCWSRAVVWMARVICGVRYRVIGSARPPGGPFIVMAKHQSAWETLAFQVLFPPQVQVLKKQLLWIPFFGWGMATLSPIAIDRSAGTRALRQMLEQGRARLAKGFWVIVFPEGTRVRPGERRAYQSGGAWLACRTETAVLPVAHNAGELWPRNGFIKYPGVVTVSIGAPIASTDKTPQMLSRAVETWIEDEMRRIGGRSYSSAPALEPRTADESR